MFWENFLKLCADNNKKPTAVALDLKISRGSVTNWKKGVIPQDSTLKKIADYFGVSLSYLMGQNELDKPRNTTFISYKSEERPKIDLRGTERIWEDSSNSAEEPDCSFDPTQEKPNPNTTELDDYEKKLIGTFRETTIDGKLRILNAADEIKKDIEKKHIGKDSSFA